MALVSVGSLYFPILFIGFLVAFVVRWRLSLRPPPGLKSLPGPWGEYVCLYWEEYYSN